MKTNIAPVVAGLLRIPVKRVNRTMAPDRRRGTQRKPVDAAGSGPADPVDTAELKPVDQADTGALTTVTTPLPPSYEERPSPQPALFPEADLAAASSPTATPDDPQLASDAQPDEGRPVSTAPDATAP